LHVTLGGSGVQHVLLSSSQMSVVCSHCDPPALPQGTLWPQLFSIVLQLWPWQVTEIEFGLHSGAPTSPVPTSARALPSAGARASLAARTSLEGRASAGASLLAPSPPSPASA
jgi:hypothetical protein